MSRKDDEFDTEMAFVRSLSVYGTTFPPGPANDEKRERIRVAILTQKRENEKMEFVPGKRETFREAFERCYHRSLDLRGRIRDHDGVIIPPRPEPPPEPMVTASVEAEEEDFDEK
jgi:hypothetical protein